MIPDLTPILLGARFRIRDCWPSGLRFLTVHLHHWKDGSRRLYCGAIRNRAPISTCEMSDGYGWEARASAGHATEEGKFAPSLTAEGVCPTEAEAQRAAEAAYLAWIAERIADGSVVCAPWLNGDDGPALFPAVPRG